MPRHYAPRFDTQKSAAHNAGVFRKREDASPMYLLKFPAHPGTYFYSDADIHRADNFITVLDCLMTLFDRYVPGIPGQPLNIKIERSADSPACFRNLKEIHLNTELQYVSQAAYQFSHELCHMRIPFFVGEDLRWFEESVCETASHFFLRKLANELSDEKYADHPALMRYAPKFSEYSARVLDGAKEVDLTSKHQMRRFTLNCYLRDENLYVAKLLLPIFEKNPGLWEAVLYLGHVPSGFCVTDSLEIWKTTARREESAIEEIRSLFLSSL
jgi:hypothetical protein